MSQCFTTVKRPRYNSLYLLSPSPPQARVFKQPTNRDGNGTGMQLAATNRQITS